MLRRVRRARAELRRDQPNLAEVDSVFLRVEEQLKRAGADQDVADMDFGSRRGPGRPPGSDRYTGSTDLLRTVAKAAKDLADAGTEPTIDRVAKRMGVFGPKGLEKALAKEGISWGKVKADALARSRKELRGVSGGNSPKTGGERRAS